LRRVFIKGLAAPRRSAILYALLIFLIGMVYRLTFVYQGWAATDEGWLQAMGWRIASGQVAYRDFNYVLPPVTIYKEGALAALLGSSWTVLTSRWLFSVEVSLASVLAYLILRRFMSDRSAFLATLPTVFFSVMIAAFTSYTYDAEFMALLAVTLAVFGGTGDRRSVAMALGAGAAAALAALSKESFLAFIPAIPLAALAGAWLRRGDERPLHPAVQALQRGWPLYLAGFVLTTAGVFAYFALTAGLGNFLYQAFVLESQAHPVSRRFILLQDMPEYITRFGAEIPLLVGLMMLALAVTVGRLYDLARTLVLAGILAFVLLVTLWRPPIPSRPFFVIVAYGALVAIGLIALGTTAAFETPWLRNHPAAAELRSRMLPPEVVFLGLILQWLAQFAYDGVLFWYEGAFLSVPIVLIFLNALNRVRSSRLRILGPARITVPALAPALIGLWFCAGGLGIVQARVYQDAPRSQLTAYFATPELRGISSYPVTEQRVDALVAEVGGRTHQGDPVFFFPDFGILYDATGRTNPTRIDWYNEAFLTPDVTAHVLADLERRPPKVVFLQTQREGAYERDQVPIDYANSKWAPIYDYLLAHYKQVGSVQDIKVLMPVSSST